MGSGPEYIGWGQSAWQYRSQKPRVMEKPLLASGGWHVHPQIHSINPYGPIGFGTAPGTGSEGRDELCI